jgi:thiosulfate dehydrogenase
MLNRKALLAWLGLIVLATGRLADTRATAAAVMPDAVWPVPSVTALPDDDWGRTVRRGYDLVAHTSALIGPHAANPRDRFAGNNLDCQSCHIDGGTRKFGLPLVGVFAVYPNYRARSGRVGTIEERINGCVERSLNGRPLPQDSVAMTAIVAYLQFLSAGQPVGVRLAGQGPGHMPELLRAADPVHGRQVFAQQCALCHGANGAGQAVGGGRPGYIMPPLWGPDSFNDGAGMARLTNAANFIRNNMPNGTTWAAPMLSVDDAWDVAAYVLSHPRPHKADLIRDFPDRREKPLDTAYGPYADSFAPDQHKYGPFQPMRDAIKARATMGTPAPIKP